MAFVPGGSSDPQCGIVKDNQRLTEAEQRGTGLAYLSAFFRAYVGGESQFVPLLTGDAPPPPSASTRNLFVSYHAPDDRDLRLDVNRLLNATNLTIDTLGETVTETGLTPYDLCGGDPPQPAKCLPNEPNARQPHTTPSACSPLRGLSQLRVGWNDPAASYDNAVPRGTRDVSGYVALQFRVSVNFADARNTPGTPQDLRVTLTDSRGRSAMVRATMCRACCSSLQAESDRCPRFS